MRRPSGSAPEPNREPDAARLVTEDITRFWHAVDRTAGQDGEARVRALRELYLRPGSAGLRDWMRLRLVDRRALSLALDRDGWSAARVERVRALPPRAAERRAYVAAVSLHVERTAAEQLARATAGRERFYAAVRANTLAIETSRRVAESIRGCFRNLKALYPDAVFPDVYFLIGRLRTGGMTGPAGILIGAEMFSCDADTPVDELTGWERAAIGSVDGLVRTVVHELVHCQQPPGRGPATLLGRALHEGAADFVGTLAGGAHPGGGARHVYGRAHEGELWAEFRQVMHGSDGSGWLYEGDRDTGRPADLGYFIGYRICEAYYRRAANGREAVRRMLTLADPEALLRESGYASFAESLPRTEPTPDSSEVS